MPKPTQRLPYENKIFAQDRDSIENARRWLEHVEAGRIGRGAGTTRAQLANHIWNERVLLGDLA